jgi:hypothetical protein
VSLLVDHLHEGQGSASRRRTAPAGLKKPREHVHDPRGKRQRLASE